MNVIHSDKDGVELADVSDSILCILCTADPLKMWRSLNNTSEQSNKLDS